MTRKDFFSIFGMSLFVTVFGLAGSLYVGMASADAEPWTRAALLVGLNSLFLCAVLSLLEVSLSFDNAVVNATVLKKMTPLWRKRFLTWGILIAVFGMRLILPLLIVAVIAKVSPLEAIRMAIWSPVEYSKMMLSIHPYVAAFGGTFLLMVGIDYFLNDEKEHHWLNWIEQPLSRLGRIKSIETILALAVVMALAHLDHGADRVVFLLSGVTGVILYLLVDALGAYLGDGGISGATDSAAALSGVDSASSGTPQTVSKDLHRASVGMFLYLEVLDASFSFDGVVGAFALTHNLLLIAIGLGIGAMFVRSITVALVRFDSLGKYQYLEHGAFWAILALAALMFAGVYAHIPEIFTGLVGAAFLVASVWASTKEKTV